MTKKRYAKISVPSTRVYAMKLILKGKVRRRKNISVPSTRVYAMKHEITYLKPVWPSDFSTLDSGLRDETIAKVFPYVNSFAYFSTLDSGLRDETKGGETK